MKWVPSVLEGNCYRSPPGSDPLVARLCSAEVGKGYKNLANHDGHWQYYKELDMTCCESKLIKVESGSGWGTKSS